MQWTDQNTIDQAKVTSDFAADLPPPILLLGDFMDLQPDSPELTTLLSGAQLRDAFANVHNNITRLPYQPYILYKGLIPKESFVLSNSLSSAGNIALVAQFEGLDFSDMWGVS